MLAETGVAGCPESYFYEPTVEGWVADLGPSRAPGATGEDVLRAVRAKGRGASSLFGLRQRAPGLGFLCDGLARLYPHETTDPGRFRRAFGNLLFVHLTRADKVAQAVSWLKAEQSGLWHVAPDGAELERTAPHRLPVYDADRLAVLVEATQAHDRIWYDWFARQGINPSSITYDDVAADPGAILRQLLDVLGLDGRVADAVGPGVRKLADATSTEWAARYRADHGLT